MMQKTLRQIVIAWLLLVVVSEATVASNGIAVTFIDYRLDSTQHVSLGYTLTISAEVRNTDTAQSFSGLLDFGLHNRSGELSHTSIFNKPPYSGNQISLGPGEVVPAIFSIDIDDPYFVPGPDVVVVWPISSSPVSDSILVNLLIQSPNGIAKNEEERVSYTIINNRILFHYALPDVSFKQVRIYNVIGQPLLQYQAESITDISLPAMPHGIYFCEILSSDSKTRVIRFYH